MQFILHVSILCEFQSQDNYRETVIIVYLVFKKVVYICIIIIHLIPNIKKKKKKNFQGHNSNPLIEYTYSKCD